VWRVETSGTPAAAAMPPQNDRRVKMGSFVIIASLPDVLPATCLKPQLKGFCHGTAACVSSPKVALGTG